MNWLLPCEIDAIKKFCIENKDEFSVELLLTKARELYLDATPRIIHDNGSQYTNDDLKKLLAHLV